jgi:hypothetical protein
MNTQSSVFQQPLFSLGKILATPALLEHFEKHQINASDYLSRHVTGDFGELDEEDKAENRLSIEHGFRILSAYRIAGERVWIITEADRSATTLLFPSEY